jgi:hypothetical protein
MDTARHCACDLLGGWLLPALWEHGTIAVAPVTTWLLWFLCVYAIRVFLRLRSHPERSMNPPQQFVSEACSGPRDISLEQVAVPGDSVLARSLALFRARLAEARPPRYAFESSL